MKKTTLSRRDILKIAAAASIPLFLPSRIFGADAPSKKINVGYIGFGWMGEQNLKTMLPIDEFRVMAMCDVDAAHLSKGIDWVNKAYNNQQCKSYTHFEELIASPDIDVVVINTPDHWHSIPAIMAAKAKKDIYCEKPLSHTFAEGLAMTAAVQASGSIWQTGSWQRSREEFRWATELILNGYIGKVSRVEVGLPQGHTNYGKKNEAMPDSSPPSGLDYERWIGPAQMMPYNEARLHMNWRWNYNTGGGGLMDWIGHHLDIAHWGLTNEYGCGITDDAIGPLTVGAVMNFPDRSASWNTARTFRITCAYPNAVEVVIAGGHPDIQEGTTWIGDKGKVHVTRGRLQPSDKKLMKMLKTQEKTLKIQLPHPTDNNHMRDFLQGIQRRTRTLTPVEVAHRSQSPGHLGVIAARLGRTLNWDAATQTIVNDPEATAMLSKKFRAPWSL